MVTSAARQQDDPTAHASKLVDETFVFDSVQVLRTGGPGRPRLLFGTDHIGTEYFDDWKAAGIKAFMHPAAMFETATESPAIAFGRSRAIDASSRSRLVIDKSCVGVSI